MSAVASTAGRASPLLGAPTCEVLCWIYSLPSTHAFSVAAKPLSFASPVRPACVPSSLPHGALTLLSASHVFLQATSTSAAADKSKLQQAVGRAKGAKEWGGALCREGANKTKWRIVCRGHATRRATSHGGCAYDQMQTSDQQR